jgi:TonB family protein
MLKRHRNWRASSLRGCLAVLIVCVGLTVGAGVAALGQQMAAVFAGTLLDATGRSLPDVPIVLASVGTGQKIEGQSDASGHFAFTGVPADEYQVQVQKPGFASKQGRVTLAPGQKLQQNLVLQLASLAQVIFVSPENGAQGASSGPRRLSTSGRAADPCNQTAAAGCVTPPTKIVDMTPRYPQTHADKRVSGKIVVDGRIGKDGYLKDLRVRTGADEAFAAATLEALRSWQFSPARLNGEPVECGISVTANFTVGQD